MALSALDPIWLRCAQALELPVLRGGDSYVHFDGARLHIAAETWLDADDSLAQLVLHEICHLLVQGPTKRRVPDWGLDNTGADPRDQDRERAAVRLQAHLAGAHGLRGALFPTTVVRPFFESLPDDALSGDELSCLLSQRGATRAGHPPFERALSEALRATARALEIPMHASGGALRHDRRCGDCAWRSDRCIAADESITVSAEDRGCSRFVATLDCRACGACCRSGYDVVPAEIDDAVVLRHPELVVARETGFDLRRVLVEDELRCVALDGYSMFSCRVYGDRPDACAELATGSEACRVARRRVGLSPS